MPVVSDFGIREARDQLLTGLDCLGIHPDRLATPPNSCRVVSAVMSDRDAPWLKPTSTILEDVVPWRTSEMMMFSSLATEDEMPTSS